MNLLWTLFASDSTFGEILCQHFHYRQTQQKVERLISTSSTSSFTVISFMLFFFVSTASPILLQKLSCNPKKSRYRFLSSWSSRSLSVWTSVSEGLTHPCASPMINFRSTPLIHIETLSIVSSCFSWCTPGDSESTPYFRPFPRHTGCVRSCFYDIISFPHN